jgi:hypothetical protein
MMKKIHFFFFTMMVSISASAQSHINIEMLSATYTTPAVKFRVSWSSIPVVIGETHNSKIWVWIDYKKIENNQLSGSWTRAEISATPVVSSSPVSAANLEPSTNKGFWLNGVIGNYSATVTVQPSNIPANTQFNWCAYASDCPPFVIADNGTYKLQGTPPFILKTANGTIQTVEGRALAASSLTIDAVTLTDKTECPSNFCPYTGSDLYRDATHLCGHRPSGVRNWEAWIKDARDNRLYRIIQMPTGTWWMAEDLIWDGKPNPTATNYTVRGVARDCGARNGCGRGYANDANAAAITQNANNRRSSNVCPNGWVIPSTNEFCPYATNNSKPQPYLAKVLFNGPDTYGLSLQICACCGWMCTNTLGHTSYLTGGYLIYGYYKANGELLNFECTRTDTMYANPANAFASLRCVRDL